MSLGPDEDTLLVMSGIGIPRYSARGIVQTLDHIPEASNVMRNINARLRDVSAPQFRKYQSTISCTDQNVPALDGVWPGTEVVVECVQELSYPVGAINPDRRPAVSGSEREENGFIFYRPILEMMVVNYTTRSDEWPADVQWQLELGEI